MRSKQITQNWVFRSFAALTLAVFVAAEAMCFAHCHMGGGHDEESGTSCHGSGSAQAGHDEDAPPSSEHSSMTACSTLQNLLNGNGALTLIVPDFHALYTLAPLALALDSTAIQPEARISRAARPRDWVFTPEVCLGPAFRSLAPPVSSLT